MSSPTTAPVISDPTHHAFQPCVQGLRAIAVLGVLAFHLDESLLPGGFTGVDIFFVISGYLISRNILRDLDDGTFSFAVFYARRMRRILPALIVTVFATFVAGCLFLSPEGLKNLARESTHALVSISNYQYWRESHDYFGVAASRQILLHVWSLALEEQFYLIWPAFLVLSARFRRAGLAILVITLVSFAAAVVWHGRDPSAAFFLTPFRVFQFGIGALLVFAEPYRKRHALISPALFAVSLLGIAASFVCMTPQAPYPVLTLLPAFSAAGIILSGGASRFDALLTNKPMQAIGAISYSLYLCHWPMIYFVRLMMPDAGDAGLAVTSVGVSVGLAALIYAFIEQPFRAVAPTRPTWTQAARLVAPLIAPIVTGALAMQLIYRTGGMEWRLTGAQTEFAERLDEPWDDCEGQAGLACIFGDRESARNVLLLGDSMTRNYVAGLDGLLARAHVRGRSLRLDGCPMIPGVRLINNPQRRIERCREETDTAAAALTADDRLLVIGQN